MVREGQIFDALAGKPVFGAGYSVIAYEPGAVVATGSSGNTVDVDAGHGFAANDKGIVGTDPTRYFQVGSVTSTELTLAGGQTLSVAAGEILVNLGADTGFTSPNYDGSGAVVYTDMDYGNVAVYSTVSANDLGRYIYHHRGIAIWELVKDELGAPFAIYIQTALGTMVLSSGTFQLFLSAQTAAMLGFTDASGAHGPFLSKASTDSGATAIGWMRDGLNNWSMGEDSATGLMSYFALWNRTASFDSGGVVQSGDIIGVSWAGADSGAQDGPAFTFNLGGFNVGGGDLDAQFEYQFGMQSKRTSGSGRRTAWFKPVTNQTGLVSGGIDISVNGNIPAMRISQLNPSPTRWRSTIQFGTQDANNQYWGMGHDLPNLNTQTFSLYDYKNATWAWFCNATGMAIGGNAPGYRLDVGGTFHASGVATLSGGIAGTQRYNIGTWCNNTATSGTDSACSNGTAYVGSIFIPLNMTLVGIQYLVGSVGGTDKVVASLHDWSGALVANSATAGATVGTAAQVQQVAFTSTYAAVGPGYYWLALTFNGTTAKFRTIPAFCQAGNGVIGNGVTQTFGTPASFTAPTNFNADKVPVASLY